MSKIRIEELSVGYWVEIEGSPRRVTYIDGAQKLVRLSGKGNPVYIGGVQPIPLTPEILEKNGLEYEDDGNDAVIFLCCDMFWARLCVGDTFWQVGIHNDDRLDAVVCNIKHTHQLQHALRLAGVGKEIEL